MKWKNTRWTGVLEKREGRWVMAQQHFSFAAKDQVCLYLRRIARHLGEQDALFGPQLELAGRVLPIAVMEPGREAVRGREQVNVLGDEARVRIIKGPHGTFRGTKKTASPRRTRRAIASPLLAP